MSVSELVKSREALMVQVKEIDGILKQAVDAYGAALPIMPRPNPNQQLSATAAPQAGRNPDAILFGDSYKSPPVIQPSPTAGNPNQYQSQTISQSQYPGQPLDPNQVVTQPQMKRDPNNPFSSDTQGGYIPFDTDSYVQEQNAISMQYVQPQTEFDIDGMQDEVSSLKQQISEGIENVKDSTGIDGDGQEDVPPAA